MKTATAAVEYYTVSDRAAHKIINLMRPIEEAVDNFRTLCVRGWNHGSFVIGNARVIDRDAVAQFYCDLGYEWDPYNSDAALEKCYKFVYPFYHDRALVICERNYYAPPMFDGEIGDAINKYSELYRNMVKEYGR